MAVHLPTDVGLKVYRSQTGHTPGLHWSDRDGARRGAGVPGNGVPEVCVLTLARFAIPLTS